MGEGTLEDHIHVHPRQTANRQQRGASSQQPNRERQILRRTGWLGAEKIAIISRRRRKSIIAVSC
jgi:hypothetical protein